MLYNQEIIQAGQGFHVGAFPPPFGTAVAFPEMLLFPLQPVKNLSLLLIDENNK